MLDRQESRETTFPCCWRYFENYIFHMYSNNTQHLLKTLNNWRTSFFFLTEGNKSFFKSLLFKNPNWEENTSICSKFRTKEVFPYEWWTVKENLQVFIFCSSFKGWFPLCSVYLMLYIPILISVCSNIFKISSYFSSPEFLPFLSAIFHLLFASF